MPHRPLPLAFLLCFLYSLCAKGQQAVYDIPGYYVTHYTDVNGLPQNSVKKDLCFDDDGFLWMATEVGLVRFDGRNFRLFSHDSAGMLYPQIYIMGRSPFNGHLFAYTGAGDDSRVALTTPGGKPVFRPVPRFLSDRALSAPNGRYTSLIFRHPHLHLLSLEIDMIIPVATDTAYVIQTGHVTYRTYREILWETDIPERPGQLPYHTNGRLYSYTPDGTFYKITPQGPVPEIQIPGFKELVWNKSENQAFVVTRKNEIYTLETDAEGRLELRLLMEYFPPGFGIETMVHMNRQIVFIGAVNHGLLVCKKKQVEVLAPDLPDEQSVFYGILPYGTDTILSSKGSLVSQTGKGIYGMLPEPRNKDRYNRWLTRSKNGFYLITREYNLLLYSPQGKLVKDFGLHTRVNTVYTDRRGRTWICLAQKGLWLLNDSLGIERAFSFSGRWIDVLYMSDLTDDLLLLGSDGGLCLFSVNEGRMYVYPQTHNTRVKSIFRSRAGRFYVCVEDQGILMLGHGPPVHLPLDRRGYLKKAHCIQQDRRGGMWISSNNGLFYAPESMFIRYAQKKDAPFYYHHLNHESGLKTDEFNGGCQPCGLSFPASGTLIFPSMDGLVKFNPYSLNRLEPVNEMEIDKIAVNDTFLRKIPDTLRVERSFNRLEIFLTTAFYGSPENLVFEYTQDSTRADAWSTVNTRENSIAFTSLPSGYSYLAFRQPKAVGSDAFSYRTLVLYKPKAFWELAWFWITCAVFMLLLVWLSVRLRTRVLRQRNKALASAVDAASQKLLLSIDSLTATTQRLEKKTRFQQWLTSSIVHDLRGPLHFINFYKGDVHPDSDTVPTPEQNRFLKSVYLSAQKAYTYSDKLVQLLRMEQADDFPVQKTDFWELAEEKMAQFEGQAKWNGVTLLLNPDSDPYIYVNRAALSIVLQNLLDNSVKNSQNGHVYLSLYGNEHDAVVTVRDEGPGLSPEMLAKFNEPDIDLIPRGVDAGIGLWLVKSIMAQTGGIIVFENSPGKGLTVTLTWPLKPTESRY